MSFFDHKQELYLFKYNDETVAITSSNKEFTFQNIIYKPDRYITRSKIVNQGANNKSPELTITMSKDSEIADWFKVTSPFRTVELFVYKVNINDPSDYLTLWSGKILSTTFQNNSVNFECFSKDQLLDKNVGRQTCAYDCQHNLYFQGCNLDISNFSIITQVKSIASDGVTIEFYDDFGTPNEYFKNGIIQKVNDEQVRMITEHNLTTIKMLYFMETLKVDDEIRLSWGCDRLPTTCHNKFNNYSQYRGEPFTPKISPFIGDIQ